MTKIVNFEITGHRCKPIFYRLGFSDVQAFNKLFRKYFGVAPSEIRPL